MATPNFTLELTVYHPPFPFFYFRFYGYSNNLAANVSESTMNIMKNAILSFAFLLFAVITFGQTETTPAQQMTDKLTEKYTLTQQQQAEMLTIQERKFRNLAEIEGLRKTDPTKHIEKMRALKIGIDGSVERLLDKNQMVIFQQEKADFRKQKSVVYSELKSSGASQMQIEYKISELEEAALMGN